MIHFDLKDQLFQCPNDLINKYKLSNPIKIEEACYLVQQNKAQIFINLKKQTIHSIYSLNQDSFDNYLVYSFLRKQGYLIRIKKFHYEVYKNNNDYFQKNILMVVFIKNVKDQIDFQQNQNVNQKKVIAIVDGGQVTLVEIQNEILLS